MEVHGRKPILGSLIIYDGVCRREEGTESQDHEMLKLSIDFFFFRDLV